MRLASLGHILMLLVAILIILLFIFNAKYFKTHARTGQKIIGLSLLAFEFTYYMISLDSFSLHYGLPLELCSFGLYTMAICFISGKNNLFKYAFPLCILGGIMALLIPLPKDPLTLSPRLFQFVGNHLLLILAVLYGVKVLNIEIKLSDFKKFLLFFTSIYWLVYLYNLITKSNYMMSVSLPGGFSSISRSLGVFYSLAFFLVLNLAYYLIYKLLILAQIDYKKRK